MSSRRQLIKSFGLRFWLLTALLDQKITGQSPAPESKTFSALDLLADQLVASDSYYGRQRLLVSSGNLVLKDFSASQASIRGADDPAARSLEYLTRAKALERDFRAAFPDAKFWEEPLKRIYATIQTLNGNAAAQPKPVMDQLDEQFRSLERLTNDYAGAHNVGTSASREPATPYNVTIRIEAPKPPIRFMTLLSYLGCKVLKMPLDDQWTDLQEGKHQLIGKYRYRADWPAEMGGTMEGTFEVKQDDIITFRPVKR